MDARLSSRTLHRRDHFGGVCYVPHRDDFFALDKPTYSLVQQLDREWKPVAKELQKAIACLARLGICETRKPATRELAYSGPSFIGDFKEIATVADPLVVNCFCTSFCPLKCVYCHADDLMQEHRKGEESYDIENVAATASLIPAMVAVITGGDPLTRPERAHRLIERLAGQKQLVLDTSGVGDISTLLPIIKQHHVHVRVSLDAISEINNKLRPINTAVANDRTGSLAKAQETVHRCLREGVGTTVQTVVTSLNSGYEELRDTRDWLLASGVQHWVLHVCVEGGSARRIEDAARKHERRQGILPSNDVYRVIKRLIDETTEAKHRLDIRCTDTGNTPNSVLLVSGNGDLYTEGLAHKGKVKLFAASDSRPDRIKDLWSYVDHFGHARRYLNWNRWFYPRQSFEDIVYPIPKTDTNATSGIVEIESKYRVSDLTLLISLLTKHAEAVAQCQLQRDEYFDTGGSALKANDFVVRVRYVDGKVDLCLKGPRFHSNSGSYSRVELEFEPRSEEALRDELRSHGLVCTWYFEKRRQDYRWRNKDIIVSVDEIPEMGYYCEIEGDLADIESVAQVLRPSLGMPETRNYSELFVAYRKNLGIGNVSGAAFGDVESGRKS